MIILYLLPSKESTNSEIILSQETINHKDTQPGTNPVEEENDDFNLNSTTNTKESTNSDILVSQEITPEDAKVNSDLNLDRILTYLTQNNIPLNLEHHVVTLQKTTNNTNLEPKIGELRLEQILKENEKIKSNEVVKMKPEDSVDEITLIDQVEVALDKIVAAADLILEAELNEEPFDEQLEGDRVFSGPTLTF